MICKRSNSFKCWQAYRLCTHGFPSEKCFNQTNRPPIPRVRHRIDTISRPPINGGENARGVTRPPRASSESYFTRTTHHYSLPYQPTMQVVQTRWPALVLPPCPQRPPRPPPPKAPHQRPSGVVIKFQTAHNQRKFKVQNKKFPPIIIVT